MKKLIILCTAIAAAAFLGGNAGPFSTQSFINGISVVIPLPGTNVSTTIGITTSVSYTNDLGQLVTAGTNAAGITYGAWARPVSVRGNALGDAGSYSVSLLSGGTGPTNTFTVTFQRSWDGTNFDTNTTWGFTTTADLSGTGTVAMTNVPSWFVTGVSHLRVGSVVFGTNSAPGTTNYISVLRLNSFAP